MRKSALFLLIVVILCNCAPSFVVVSPLTRKLPPSPRLVIGDIGYMNPANGDSKDYPSQEIIWKIRDYLRESLKKEGLFSEISMTGVDTSLSDDCLIVKGQILHYQAGSRAVRYFVGMGAGKRKLVVQLSLESLEGGEELFVGNFKAEVSSGFFGGSSDEPLRRIGRDFTQYLKKNWN